MYSLNLLFSPLHEAWTFLFRTTRITFIYKLFTISFRFGRKNIRNQATHHEWELPSSVDFSRWLVPVWETILCSTIVNNNDIITTLTYKLKADQKVVHPALCESTLNVTKTPLHKHTSHYIDCGLPLLSSYTYRLSIWIFIKSKICDNPTTLQTPNLMKNDTVVVWKRMQNKHPN